MNEVRGTQVKGGPRRGLSAYVLWGAALIGVAAVLYVIATAIIKSVGAGASPPVPIPSSIERFLRRSGVHFGGIWPGGPADLRSLARGEMAKLEVSAKAGPAPDTPILDAQDHAIRLADLKAPVLIVNLWATWCAPCVKEMPTLAKLQAAYPGRLLVAPVSMDRLADREKARAFIAEHPPLGFYQDPKYALAFALDPPAEGFPTTVIYDAKGRERARLSGAADWSGPDARALVEAMTARP